MLTQRIAAAITMHKNRACAKFISDAVQCACKYGFIGTYLKITTGGGGGRIVGYDQRFEVHIAKWCAEQLGYTATIDFTKEELKIEW